MYFDIKRYLFELSTDVTIINNLLIIGFSWILDNYFLDFIRLEWMSFNF